jgi:hypothetical protein
VVSAHALATVPTVVNHKGSRVGWSFHGFGGPIDLSGETVRTLADQPAAERTNEGQCLCFGAEPQSECGPLPGGLLQDDRL